MLVEKKKSRLSEIPTSSLADIAFLLLIFFLVTTTIDVDKGISLVLPEKGETKEVHKKNIANILINANGQVMLNEEPIEIPMLRNRVKQMITENDKLIISVKTDAKTKYETYVDVLDELKLANATKISIAEPEY
jgi:biopolymer transport protein ExbD